MHNETVPGCGFKKVKKWHVTAKNGNIFCHKGMRSRRFIFCFYRALFQEGQGFGSLVTKVYRQESLVVSRMELRHLYFSFCCRITPLIFWFLGDQK